MDYTPLLTWEFIENDKMVGTLDTFYVLIRKTNNQKPFELRLFKSGNIWFFVSFDNINKAARFAQSVVDAYYYLKNPIKEEKEDNNIVYIKKWRESHGSKE